MVLSLLLLIPETLLVKIGSYIAKVLLLWLLMLFFVGGGVIVVAVDVDVVIVVNPKNLPLKFGQN